LHIANQLEEKIRFQEYGVGIFATITTKSALKKAIKKGLITIDGVLAATATYINGGEEILYTEEFLERESKNLDIKISVLFEDAYLAIVHKPAGLLVSGNKHKTLVNALPNSLQLTSEADSLTSPQPAHRLDFATSGLVVVAKTKKTLVALHILFKEKTIAKTYHAVTIREMPLCGTIIASVDDKPSETNFEVLQTVPSERFGSLNLVQLFPKTGRRHQVRKHLQSIGSPILGDSLYCKQEDVLKGKGLYLQASAIEFMHPITHKKIKITIPLPKKFLKIFPENPLN
jgi:23S rRNA pseudouridine1911/1915/1917 synthase